MPPEGAGDSQQARDRVLAEVLWKTREAVVASKGPNSLAAAPSPALTFPTRPQPSSRRGPQWGV